MLYHFRIIREFTTKPLYFVDKQAAINAYNNFNVNNPDTKVALLQGNFAGNDINTLQNFGKVFLIVSK